MALGCGLTSVRGDRGENYEKLTTVSPKKYKEKKNFPQIKSFCSFATSFRLNCFVMKLEMALTLKLY
jgi:hypothetical protein